MPPKRAARGPVKRTFTPLPANTGWIENDAYDRRVWEQLRLDSPSLAELEQSGATLLPHFDALLQDLFCLMFKYNVSYRDAGAVLPSALLNRTLLAGVHQGKQYEFLREQTLLHEAHAGLAALIIGERLLGIIRRQEILNQRDLRDLWDIRKQEELVGEKIKAYEDADTIPENKISDQGKKALAKAKEKMAGEVQGAEALLRHKSSQLKEDLERIENQARQRLAAETVKLARDLEETAEETETWGETLGTGRKSPPGQKLELGRRLAGNDKLKKLARLVGRMKFEARALRKKVFERSSEEILQVEQGDSLHRLLPNELLSLHHPLLRKDFFRRLLDRELIQYSLSGTEEKGKGPMIVCLDGSSSMSGDKEIWSKAVALTLLDTAKRQRRLFRSICFSSADTPLQVLDMNPKDRRESETKTIMELAEYFPGGGTDFQTPLAAALECLKESRFRKGDIIFITDGECQVSPEWAAQFRHDKDALGFSLYSILIDTGPASLGTLREFSDRITTISRLTGEGAREIFLDM